MFLDTYDFFTPLAVFFSLLFGSKRLYILLQRQTNSRGATLLVSSLNLPITFALVLLWRGWPQGQSEVSRCSNISLYRSSVRIWYVRLSVSVNNNLALSPYTDKIWL